MKKLHLNKVFHWLYAILMFLPFILLICNMIIMFGKLSPLGEDGTYLYPSDFINSLLYGFIPSYLFEYGELHDVHVALTNVFAFFTGADVDGTMVENSVWSLFLYWTEVSLLYVVFDVLMLPINIAHHWIDKGSDRL